MKRKCDGKQPCARCARRKRECFYSYKQKSGPPKGSKRKLIEAEDDLPENRSNKHPLGGAPLPLAAPAPAPPWSGGIKDATTTWSEGNIAETTITNNTDEAQSCAQPGSAPSEPLPLPLPAPSPEARAAAAAAVAASRMNALAPVPPALAAAGLHRSYMLQAPAVLPGLSGLQTPSVLPGLTGGGGGSGVGGAGGGGPAPTTTPLVTHPQYGTVYQHQYPPEVYALYLAELRQRSCGNNIGGGGGGGGGDGGSTGSPSTSTASTSISGCTSTNTNTNTSTSNISNNQGGSAGGGGGVGGSCGVDGDVGGGGGGGHVASMPEGPTTTVPASFLSNLYEGRQGWASEASSAVSSDPTARVTSAEASTNVGPASKQSSTGGIGRMSQPIIFGESSLEAGQGASGCWGSNSGGGVADGSGRGGGGGGGDNGGCAPNGVELTHVAKGVGVGDGGADGDGGGYVYEPAKAAAAAAAASAALAAAVAAAIAESSSGPNDNGNDIQNVNHNDKLSETTLPSWDGGSGSAWPSLPGIGVGLRDPVSPVKKGNPLEAESEAAAAVAAEPKSRGATTTMGVTDGVDELFYGSSGSRATTPRERQAAAGLLLYGARGGQAGGGGEHGVAKEKDERFQRKGSSAVAKVGAGVGGGVGGGVYYLAGYAENYSAVWACHHQKVCVRTPCNYGWLRVKGYSVAS